MPSRNKILCLGRKGLKGVSRRISKHKPPKNRRIRTEPLKTEKPPSNTCKNSKVRHVDTRLPRPAKDFLDHAREADCGQGLELLLERRPHKRPLPILDLDHALLDGTLDNEPVDLGRPGLAQTVNPVDGLLLDCGGPPWTWSADIIHDGGGGGRWLTGIGQYGRVRGDEADAHTGSPKAGQHDSDIGIFIQRLGGVVPEVSRHGPVDPRVLNVLFPQVVGDKVQERRPLGEDDNLGAPVPEPLLDEIDEDLGLGAVVVLIRDFVLEHGLFVQLRDLRGAEAILANGTRQSVPEGAVNARLAEHVCTRNNHWAAFEVDGLVALATGKVSLERQVQQLGSLCLVQVPVCLAEYLIQFFPGALHALLFAQGPVIAHLPKSKKSLQKVVPKRISPRFEEHRSRFLGILTASGCVRSVGISKGVGQYAQKYLVHAILGLGEFDPNNLLMFRGQLEIDEAHLLGPSETDCRHDVLEKLMIALQAANDFRGPLL